MISEAELQQIEKRLEDADRSDVPTDGAFRVIDAYRALKRDNEFLGAEYAKLDALNDEVGQKAAALEEEKRKLVADFITASGQCAEEHHWKGNCSADEIRAELERVKAERDEACAATNTNAKHWEAAEQRAAAAENDVVMIAEYIHFGGCGGEPQTERGAEAFEKVAKLVDERDRLKERATAAEAALAKHRNAPRCGRCNTDELLGITSLAEGVCAHCRRIEHDRKRIEELEGIVTKGAELLAAAEARERALRNTMQAVRDVLSDVRPFDGDKESGCALEAAKVSLDAALTPPAAEGTTRHPTIQALNEKRLAEEPEVRAAYEEAAAEGMTLLPKNEVLRLIREQPYAPGTHTGTRQRWVLDELARAVESWPAPPSAEGTTPDADPRNDDGEPTPIARNGACEHCGGPRSEWHSETCCEAPAAEGTNPPPCAPAQPSASGDGDAKCPECGHDAGFHGGISGCTVGWRDDCLQQEPIGCECTADPMNERGDAPASPPPAEPLPICVRDIFPESVSPKCHCGRPGCQPPAEQSEGRGGMDANTRITFTPAALKHHDATVRAKALEEAAQAAESEPEYPEAKGDEPVLSVIRDYPLVGIRAAAADMKKAIAERIRSLATPPSVSTEDSGNGEFIDGEGA